MNDKKPWLDLDQLTQRLCVVTAEQLGLPPAKVKPESRLIEDLNCDSLELLELIMETEEEFGLTIPETPSTPVGKLIFTRSPFRIRDLAEYAFLNQGSGAPSRRGWRKSKTIIPVESEREFSQLGGRWSGDIGDDKSLFEVLTSDHPYAKFRRKRDGMVCVRLPASEVTIGSDANDAINDEKPSHPVSLSSFLMDIEPVSVTAFCRFLNSIESPPQKVESLVGLPADDERRAHLQFEYQNDRWIPKSTVQMQPVVLVSWLSANAYSMWANGRNWREYEFSDGFLPSEAQWEYASEEAFNAPELIYAGLHGRGQTYSDGMLPIANVHQSFGVSKFGLRHMSGTIWHWCSDWFDPNFYLTPEAKNLNPMNQIVTSIRSERGGSWVGPLELCRPTYRRGRNPLARGRCLGFRCISPLTDVVSVSTITA